jgi:signal-transduction protein with cAMP-binding, CBS, and nucleotidyltransferase domain
VTKDIAPFIVLEDTAMSKLHFLFLMLNISQVNIVNQG